MMSTEDLLAKQVLLEKQNSVFSSQSMGSKSFIRDLRYLTDQLNAIAFVLRERGYTGIIEPPAAGNYGYGTTSWESMKL